MTKRYMHQTGDPRSTRIPDGNGLASKKLDTAVVLAANVPEQFDTQLPVG